MRHAKATLGPACYDLEARLEAERARFVQQIVTAEARQGIEALLGIGTSGGKVEK